MNPTDVTRATREANESRVVEWGARTGFAVLGGLHLLIGYLALSVAWGVGGGSREADQSGALRTLAGSPVGEALLWVGVVGFVLLALWSLTEGVIGRSEVADRAKLLARGILYGFFAWSTIKVAALGGTGNSERQTDDVTQRLMSSPAGQVLVGIVGLVVLGVAVHHVVKGWRAGFLEDLREHPGRWAVRAGRFGYVAKGLALAVVGVFFLVAAWTQDPQDAKGLDGALKTLKDMTAGPLVLTVVALGIAAYGVYSFARARYARL
ncbi:DUF1206 domain-containing protein [Phycicoccus endophyticus]|uniref:DUF1206 domain-containing protein n=1 Tax=Phycicoccus endophyticus TaxID=1690220 RepID=A0A7G9R1B6_9MICO|nr:DUF1206 domain-containing protein [Phycicoccus endophyticus]NHI18831.1 DUF1206 domain-containing protein [Phycicoccus endophyticus]QNN49391.1 DUF1206 domain-containing protein [Phycicoccus endophyticus]GGL36183.1 membrane protein [Phycicoccus endophyticus]